MMVLEALSTVIAILGWLVTGSAGYEAARGAIGTARVRTVLGALLLTVALAMMHSAGAP